MTARGKLSAAWLALGVLAAACTGGGSSGVTPAPPSTGDATQLAAQMASTDLYTGVPQRVLVGIDRKSVV